MEPKTLYNELPYLGYAYPQSHPDRLATIALLYGMRPARVDRCRVLELGCGDGANLIPMALTLPESQFLGIDFALSPIRKGQRQISQLGLKNIRLEAKDIMDFSSQGAPFDYIIAHGVYSWVPPVVQERIFEIFEHYLCPQGIAYISYNTLPGGHIRLMLREMMLYHCEKFELSNEKIERAKSLVRHMAGAQIEPNRYGILLRDEWERNILPRSPYALFHDELAQHNTHVYFHQFMGQAARHHLQFLSEADFRDMQPSNIEPSVLHFLQGLGDDVIAREQYLDFIYGKRFRQTLLCRSSVLVDRRVTVERVAGLLAAADVRPESFLPLDASDYPVRFTLTGTGSDSASVTTSHPLVKAALACLNKTRPLPLSFDSLWVAAHGQLLSWGSRSLFDSPDDRNGLAKMLFECNGAGLIELRSWSPIMTATPGACPLASPLARLQSLTQDLVTTLCHRQVEISERVSKVLLRLLDGTRDRTAILKDLEQTVSRHEITKTPDGTEDQDKEHAMRIGEEDLDRQLMELARLGLIVS